MIKGAKLFVIFIAVILVSSSICIASFSYKNNDIEKTYSAGSKIRGTINISFTNEPADSILKSNFNGTIELLDLLKENDFVEGADYNCSFPGCEDSYSAIGTASSISLSAGEPVYVGFKIPKAEDVAIFIPEENPESSLKFSITSNAGVSCEKQILVDVLDKDEAFVGSNKNSGNVCGYEYTGCFNSGADTQMVDITTNLYCENISLRPSPAYQIGAVVKNGSSTADLLMSLYSSEWESLGECILPEHKENIESLGCIVNYTVATKGDYFVCINSDSNAEYQIKSEEKSPRCGTSTGAEPYDIDFEIFARPIEFDAVGTLNVNSSVFSDLNVGEDLLVYADNYIRDKYQRNCSKGCIIPFKITGISQAISFSDGVQTLKYTKDGKENVPLYAGNLQMLEKEKATITTAKPLSIDLSYADFIIPITTPNKTKLYLYLNEKSILSSPITLNIIPSFAFEISPKTILFGTETDFQVVTPYNITSSEWDFGDGTTGTSTGKFISHRYRQYDETGYILTVSITRKDKVTATNKFDIAIGSLSVAANELLEEYKERVNEVAGQIDEYPEFVAGGLEEKINIDEKNTSLNSISRALGNASSNEEYLVLINEALLVNPPAEISIAEEGTIPFSAGFENIDVGFIKQISESDLPESKDNDIMLAIGDWFNKNYDASTTYSILAATGDSGLKERILTKIKLTITKKAEADESANNAYLIINYPAEGIRFAGNYSEKQVGSGVYLPISGSGTIEFVILDDVKVYDLGLYISPTISGLETFRQVEFVEKPGFNWGRFIFWMIIVLIIAFAIYIAMQEWYKRKYESHLFKNPNDLYNVINFIFNSRKNGLNDIEIAKKLKNAGWNGEQITYAFKKVDGKRTGMWEIPIFRFFEKRKIQQEIEKRKTPPQNPQMAQAQQQTKPLLK